MPAALDPYLAKRDFSITSEPKGGASSAAGRLAFVIQKHDATRLHYDFRLELDGTLKSWAVPKGPSLDPADKRMAVHVEDHPLDYGSFEGEIPKGQYGGGAVIVWDNGTWEPIGDPRAGYLAGKLKFTLHGKKLSGGWTLVRMHGRAGERQEPWLLIKERDDAARPAAEYNVVEAEQGSVLSDRTIPNPQPKAGKATSKAKGASGTRTASLSSTRADAKAVSAKAVSASAKALPAGAKTLPVSAKALPASGKAAPAKARAGSAVAGDTPAPLQLPAGAKPAVLPDTLVPQLATLVAQAPTDAGWLYEIKFDGYRLLARVDDDDVRLVTRNGNDWSSRMPGLVSAVRALGIGSGWLDGEIVVAGAHGTPDFNLLQNAFDSSRTDSIQYYVFDLPFHAGHDLRAVPLSERRALLRAVLEATPAQERIRFSQDFNTSPEELLHNACRMRLEGVIGKRADSVYASRRSPTWIKLKCTQRQEFVIGGYTDPKGARTGIGSLLLGIYDEAGALHFAGGVGSGFDERTLVAVKQALTAVDSSQRPFVEKPPGRSHWVEPKLVAEVSFGEWTPDGRIRHAVFHGLRDDKPARSIVREQAAQTAGVAAAAAAEVRRGSEAATTATKKVPAKAAKVTKATSDATVEGIRISHPERVIDPSTGITKLELANYYLTVSKLMLPHLVKRPVSLVRAPAGITGHLFFQKHASALKIADLKQLDQAIAPELEPMVEVDSFSALIGAAQANVIEFHTWNATTRDTTRPDRMVFDLDPGEGVSWQQIQEGTELTRSLLEQLGLVSFLKTSGGKGLHVVVPLTPKDDWDTVKALSRSIVEHMAKVVPERFVAKSGPKNRVGRIFVDYLRNGFGATTASAWSARARAGLGISVPCAWDELGTITGGAHWTIRNVGDRLEEHVDPWRALAGTRQSLSTAMKALGVERATAAA
ncbi:MAG: DNA ligase D [Pseudomonadota bacterium]|nr:DNA ligase D [Pseudomonadota bacterium]